MSEASELLKSLSDVEYESYSAASPVNDVIEIDANGRFINIPRTEVLLGVETDKDVERKYFRCPRYVGDNIDLTKLQLRVNYQNAEQEKDAHIVQDVTVDGQYINFSWKLSDKVLAAQGTVIFTIQAVSSESDGTLKNRWNTTLASGNVLETLIVELDYYEEEQARELLTELLQMMDNKSAESIQKIQKETTTQLGRITTTGTQQVQAVKDEGVRVLETIPADYQETYKMADEGIRTKVDAITDGVESQDTIVLTNAANDPLRGLKLYGKTEQVTTNGYQLFDASVLPNNTQGGATITNNGDGTFTVSGSGTLTEPFARCKDYTHEESVKLIKSGLLKGNYMTKTYPFLYFEIHVGGNYMGEVSNVSAVKNQLEILESWVNDPTFFVRMGMYGDKNSTIIPGTIKPMVYQDGDGTWEPYTGGIPSPSPDYPQELDSLGEMGNLFDKNAVTKDRAISDETGEEFAASGYYASDYIDVSESKDIYITTTNSAAQWGSFYDSDKKFISGFSGFNTTRKIPSNAKYIRVTVVADALDTFVINEGTTPLPWRPYTGQKEIESRITGKNLCLMKDIQVQLYPGYSRITVTDNVITLYSAVDDGFIFGNGVLKKGRTYTISGNAIDYTNIRIYNISNFYAIKSEITPDSKGDFCVTYTPTVDGDAVRIWTSNNKTCIVTNLQIEENNKKTDYQLPTKQSLYTPVSNGLPGLPLGQTIPDEIKNSPMHMSGVYWDEEDQQYYISDTVNYETGKYEQMIGKYVITGNEVVSKTTDGGNVFIIDVNNNILKLRKYNILCSNYISNFSNNAGSIYSNGYNTVVISDYTSTTTDEFKAFLAEEYRNGTPVTIQYILLTPTTRDLTATEMAAYRALRTNKPTTVIFNDCKARMGVKYNVDLESRMDENAAEERHESDLAYSNSIVQNVSGEKLLIQDSSKAPLQGLKMYGKTKQFKTTGKNLLPYPYSSGNMTYAGVTITDNGDGSITLNGTATANFSYNFMDKGTMSVKGAYTISGLTSGSTSTYYMQGYVNGSYGLPQATSPITNTWDGVLEGFYMFIKSGAVFNNLTVKPQLELGSVATDYEPYTGGQPSPSPDYPQELKSAGQASGQIESVVLGGNLCIENIKGYFGPNASKIIIDNDAEIFIFYASKDVTYTFGADVRGDRAFIGYSDSIPNYQGAPLYDITELATNSSKIYTFTSKHNAYVGIYYNYTRNDEIGKTFRVNVGDTLLTYEPYKQPQSLITKTPNGLLGIIATDAHETLANYIDGKGQTWCCDEIDLERGKYIQRIGVIVCDGSEKWTKTTLETYNAFLSETIINMKRQSELLCNIYPYRYQTLDNIITTARGSGYYLWVVDNTYNTSEEFKAMLSENPMTVYYILETPIIRDLTKEELKAFKALRSNYPTTTIMNDANAHMEASYVVDTKTYIDKKFAELAARLSQ